MKKILTFILAAVLAVSVAGCGDKNNKTPEVPDTGNQTSAENEQNIATDNFNSENTDNGTSDENSGNDAEATPEQDPENSEAASDDETDNPSENDGETNPDAEDEEDEDAEDEKPGNVSSTVSSLGVKIPNIKKQTVVDTNECSIVITGMKDDSFTGPTLSVELKNKSKDNAYIFTLNDSYINGVYTPMYLYTEVEPGDTASGEISLSVSDLVAYGLTDLTDIELQFEVKDSNSSWIDPPEVLETVNIQPYGKKSAKNFSLDKKYIQNVYIDNKYAKISALQYYRNDIYGYCIDIFIENRTNSNIAVKFEDTTVNGKLLDPYVYEIVNKGKSTIARVDWPISEFEENGIDTFREIKFAIVVSNNDDLSGKNYSRDEIALSFGQ